MVSIGIWIFPILCFNTATGTVIPIVTSEACTSALLKNDKIVSCCDTLIKKYTFKGDLLKWYSTEELTAQCKGHLVDFLCSRNLEPDDEMDQICNEVSGKVYHGEDVGYLLEFQKKHNKDAYKWTKGRFPFPIEDIKPKLLNALILNPGKLEVEYRKLSILFKKTQSDYEFWHRELSRKGDRYIWYSQDVYNLLKFPQDLDLYTKNKEEVIEIDCPFMVIKWIAMVFRNIGKKLSNLTLLALIGPVFNWSTSNRIESPGYIELLFKAFDENGLNEFNMGGFLEEGVSFYLLEGVSHDGPWSLSNAIKLSLTTCVISKETFPECQKNWLDIVKYLKEYATIDVIEDFQRISYEKSMFSLNKYVDTFQKMAVKIKYFSFPGRKGDRLQKLRKIVFTTFYVTKWTFTEEADGWDIVFKKSVDSISGYSDENLIRIVEIFSSRVDKYLKDCRKNRNKNNCVKSANNMWHDINSIKTIL